jgi:hypothetical protein
LNQRQFITQLPGTPLIAHGQALSERLAQQASQLRQGSRVEHIVSAEQSAPCLPDAMCEEIELADGMRVARNAQQHAALARRLEYPRQIEHAGRPLAEQPSGRSAAPLGDRNDCEWPSPLRRAVAAEYCDHGCL